MNNQNIEKKKEVIKWLREFKRLSSSRFVGLLGLDYDSIKKILDELKQEKKIKKIEETLATYWELIENGKN